MIYFTTFMFTLLLSHVARAVPCGNVASPQKKYDINQPILSDLPTYKVTWDDIYDSGDVNTNNVACSNGPNGLAGTYPYFEDFPDFPYLGGAFDVKWGSPNCGKCWNLTDTQTSRWIYFTAIDATESGFNIGQEAFTALNGGTVGNGTLEVEAISVPVHFCGR